MLQNLNITRTYILILALLLKAIVIAFIISAGFIGLGPDEAQYWTWSQELSWGYYSKPPAIAWDIGLGTYLFGNNEFGVRFGALVIGLSLPLLIYILAFQCRLSVKAAFWSALCMAFSPLGIAASFFATTDGGMVLFWILSCMILVPALRDGKKPAYLLLGLAIACGALFKWPIYLFWLFFLAYPRLWDKKLLAGMLVSLIGLFPSLIWNVDHNWATFRHVFSTVKGGDAPHGNFFEFLGAQVGLLSPILFILILISWRHVKKLSAELFFCAASCAVIVVGLATMSLFQKIQGNWGIFAYPPAFVVACWFFVDYLDWRRWIKIGVGLSAILCSVVIAIPYAQIKGLSISYKMNPFRHNMGWKQLTAELQRAGYNPEEHFLFGDKYQSSSLLSFYGGKQQRAYFLNLHGIRNNQFSYWPGMAEERVGKTGYFVLSENAPYLEKNQELRINEYKESLSKYFSHVDYLGLQSLFEVDGKMVKGAFIFKCTDYNGLTPEATSLY